MTIGVASANATILATAMSVRITNDGDAQRLFIFAGEPLEQAQDNGEWLSATKSIHMEDWR